MTSCTLAKIAGLLILSPKEHLTTVQEMTFAKTYTTKVMTSFSLAWDLLGILNCCGSFIIGLQITD